MADECRGLPLFRRPALPCLRRTSAPEVKGLAHLLAIDVRTGETLWELPVPNSDQGIGAQRITVSRDRLYLPHWTWLDLVNRKTGRHEGTIGRG